MAAVPSIGRADSAADLTRDLYERHSAQLFRYCLHQLGSREEAEDAVQSTFLNAFRGITRGVVPERESAWLFKIAHNVCLSRRRSTWRRGRVESSADFEVVEEVTPAPSRRADELVGLQDVLERMPAKQRRAILLREWQGLSYREIAAELEVSQTAVETLVFRARRSLAQGLAEQAEPAQARRLVRGVDLGNVAAALKSLLLGGGAAAVKVAAVATVVGTVAVATPLDRDFHHARRPAAHTTAPPRAAKPAPRTVHHAAPAKPLRHPAVRVQAKVRKSAPAPTVPAKQPPVTVDTAPPPVQTAPPQAPPTPAAPPSTPAAAPAAADASPSAAAAAPSPPADSQAHAWTARQDPAGDPTPAVVAAAQQHATGWVQNLRNGLDEEDRPDHGPVQVPSQGAASTPSAVPASTQPALPSLPTTTPTVTTPDVSSSAGDGNTNANATWSSVIGHGQGVSLSRDR